MDSDASKIPVLPIPFAHSLSQFAQALTAGQATIVAIGSSTTAGEGNITPYPDRLKTFLQEEYPKAKINMVNKGVSGQEAPSELRRFDADVIAQNPDLVIWQVGTNAVWQSPDQNPPSFDETVTAIHDGLAKLRNQTPADVVLMDLPLASSPVDIHEVEYGVRYLSDVALRQSPSLRRGTSPR